MERLAGAMVIGAPSLIQLVLMVLASEWVFWCVLTYMIKDRPRCPVCGNRFLWSQLDASDTEGHGRVRLRKLAFQCPNCKQLIGVPSWRRSALWILYIAFFFGFLTLFLEIVPPNSDRELWIAYGGSLGASISAIRIVDWFIWRRLEPGSPSPLT